MSNQPPRPPGGDDPEWPAAPGSGPPEGSPPPSSPPPSSQPPSGGGSPPPDSTPPAAPPPSGGPPPAPPPASGGGFAQPSGYSIGDAFNWGWQKFQQNLGPILIGALIYIVGAAIVGFVWWLIVSAIIGFGDPGGTGFVAMMVLSGLASLVFAALGFLIQAAITRAALGVADGRRIEVSTLLATDHLGQILLTALLVGVITGVGYMLCYLPGIIAMFFLQFAIHFVVDRRMSAMDGIRASFAFVNQHVGTLIGFFLLSGVALFVGALVCGIGMIVALPVVVLAQVYTYRRLQGQPVAA